MTAYTFTMELESHLKRMPDGKIKNLSALAEAWLCCFVSLRYETQMQRFNGVLMEAWDTSRAKEERSERGA
jgi:hypothetical protein